MWLRQTGLIFHVFKNKNMHEKNLNTFLYEHKNIKKTFLTSMMLSTTFPLHQLSPNMQSDTPPDIAHRQIRPDKLRFQENCFKTQISTTAFYNSVNLCIIHCCSFCRSLFYCILLYFIVFYCILLYFIVFYCVTLHMSPNFLFGCVLSKHVARIVSGGGSFSVCGADIFRVLLYMYCYSLLTMSTVSVTEYTNIVVIK